MMEGSWEDRRDDVTDVPLRQAVKRGQVSFVHQQEATQAPRLSSLASDAGDCSLLSTLLYSPITITVAAVSLSLMCLAIDTPLKWIPVRFSPLLSSSRRLQVPNDSKPTHKPKLESGKLPIIAHLMA